MDELNKLPQEENDGRALNRQDFRELSNLYNRMRRDKLYKKQKIGQSRMERSTRGQVYPLVNGSIMGGKFTLLQNDSPGPNDSARQIKVRYIF